MYGAHATPLGLSCHSEPPLEEIRPGKHRITEIAVYIQCNLEIINGSLY